MLTTKGGVATLFMSPRVVGSGEQRLLREKTATTRRRRTPCCSLQPHGNWSASDFPKRDDRWREAAISMWEADASRPNAATPTALPDMPIVAVISYGWVRSTAAD